jgi:uncharacterized protein YidB (DUF937 family)/outer membrane protein OmpA-like peptidoglycan-associated protein
MFDMIIREVASKFGLGDKAGPLVQMLLAYMTNSQTGGLTGFIDKFKSAGMGSLVSSWLGGGANAQAISTSQVEQLFGGSGGLLGMLTSKLGIGGSAASGALSFLLPSIIGKLTPGGSIPTSLPSEVMGFIGNAKDLLGGGASALAGGAAAATGAASAAAKSSGGMMKWVALAIAALVAAYLLSQCSGKPATPAAPKVEPPKVEAPKVETPAPVAAAPAPTPAPAPAAVEVPKGAGVLTWVSNSMPALKVYFDTGKTDVHSDWSAKSGELVSFLKANAGAKAVISGFNDPTGNAAANAELSKNRAKAVAAALKAAGIEDGRVELRKPADTTAGAGASNAEARRVEVTIEK